MKAVQQILSFFVIVFLIELTGATAQEPAKTPNVLKTEQPVQTKTTVPDDSAIIAQNTDNPYKNTKTERYRIGFQDTIEVQVAKHADMSQTVNVSSDGTILLPRIKQPIVAVCKTESELRDTIVAHLKTVLRDPFVNVRAVEQRSQPFAVVGAVKKPGSFYLNKEMRLLELLAYAGGPDVEYAGSRIQIARGGNTSGCSETENEAEKEIKCQSFNLNDVLKGKSNPQMQPGDIVSVLIAEEAYVVGNVKKPTKIMLKEERTLTQALADAGGIDGTAKTDRIIIQRQEAETGNKVELAFNLKDIQSKKIPDPVLQGNDIVVVSDNKLKKLGSEFFKIFKQSVPVILY